MSSSPTSAPVWQERWDANAIDAFDRSPTRAKVFPIDTAEPSVHGGSSYDPGAPDPNAASSRPWAARPQPVPPDARSAFSRRLTSGMVGSSGTSVMYCS